MSRTRRGSKAPGYDYWSGRAHSDKPIGRETKKLTAKAERQEAKSDIRLGFEEIEAKGDEPCPCCGQHCGLDPEVCEETVFGAICDYFDEAEKNNHE